MSLYYSLKNAIIKIVYKICLRRGSFFSNVEKLTSLLKMTSFADIFQIILLTFKVFAFQF